MLVKRWHCVVTQCIRIRERGSLHFFQEKQPTTFTFKSISTQYFALFSYLCQDCKTSANDKAAINKLISPDSGTNGHTVYISGVVTRRNEEFD
jgi:hypothetical protein